MDYKTARSNMVDSQLRTNRVHDLRVLEAFETVPRELFVPERIRGIAYVDEDLPLGNGRYLTEPMVLARLISAADIGPADAVLHVGCGTGYGTLILARLAGTVIGLESDPQLAARARELVSQLEQDNAVIVEGPLASGWAAEAPYDAILIDGAVSEVPEALRQQLGDGGRLLAVEREEGRPGRARLYRLDGTVISGRTLFDASTPLIPELRREPGFVF